MTTCEWPLTRVTALHPGRAFLQVAAQVDSEHLRLGLEGEAFVVVVVRNRSI